MVCYLLKYAYRPFPPWFGEDTAMPFHILTAIPNRELLIIESRFGVIKDQIST